MQQKKTLESTNKTIGGKIKNARMMAGLSQSALARTLKISPQQIHKYEDGSNTISAQKIMLISQVLNLPASYFLNDDKMDEHPFFSAVLDGEDNSSTEDAYSLVKMFLKIRSAKSRKILVDLAKVLAKND